MKKTTRKPKPTKPTIWQYKRGHEPETLRRAADIISAAVCPCGFCHIKGPDALKLARRFEREARAAGKVKP